MGSSFLPWEKRRSGEAQVHKRFNRERLCQKWPPDISRPSHDSFCLALGSWIIMQAQIINKTLIASLPPATWFAFAEIDESVRSMRRGATAPLAFSSTPLPSLTSVTKQRIKATR